MNKTDKETHLIIWCDNFRTIHLIDQIDEYLVEVDDVKVLVEIKSEELW